ncbi:uncharacterized protein LOC119729244 [Patiria miniata]|uniref:Uncharacterized protein n=1 Tax=Patiria miniata TaxID=46514 RepID=A0A914A286_PATMI|nr:uncharacterized protein LOC119729244 [Patiria miniata]
MASLGSSSTRMLHAGGIYTVICVGFAVLMMTGGAMAQCNASQCAIISNTIRFTVDIDSIMTDTCFDDGTTITISCNRGYQAMVKEYNTTCDGDTGEFEDEGSCELDMLTLIIAIVLMLVILFVFILLIFLVRKRYTKKKMKAMYDTSRDISEIIDGHNEEGGVTNIAMGTMPPSPRILIPIEDPYDMHNEVGTQTTVEVHYANSSAALKNEAQSAAMGNGDIKYANASAMEDSGDTIDGYGTINENGMLPSDPQAGNSTEKLIDAERDEPDGQDSAIVPYASIGDWPLNRARRGPSDASLGGSARVRPVTAPPVFSDKSASVRASGSTDGIPVEAVYAKINKVKRASERWPPGGKDPTRPRGRQADLGDLLNHIDKPSQSWSPQSEDSPTRPEEESKPVEGLYAEVPENFASSSVKVNPPPPAPKPARDRSKASGSRPIKRYAPPSRSQTVAGDSETAVMYTEVDKSRPASTPNLIRSNFAPPSPPPIDGTDGLYAQIDRDRKSSTDAIQGDRDSPNNSDEGFVDHGITTKL